MTGLDKPKLAKVLAMTGSQHDGERAAAAALADRMVRAAGLTWDRVLAGGGAPPINEYSIRNAAFAEGYARGKADAAEDKEDERDAGDRRWDDFTEANPELAAWIAGSAKRGLEFAKSLMAGVRKFGSLTPKQEAAVRRNIARDKGADTW